MAEVEARTAEVKVRTVTITKALLKQVRVFRGAIPEPFGLPSQMEERIQRLNKEHIVGWFRGSVLGEEYDDFILFAKDGDLYLAKCGRSAGRYDLSGVKQLYI